MRFDKLTVRILVRKNYGQCFDFYTQKLGLTPVWGDRNGPYTSFATAPGQPPCFAIFSGTNMPMFQGYQPPVGAPQQPDTVVAILPTSDLEGDYQRLRAAGVQFLGEPQYIADWGMHCTYFRDPEGNLFELSGGDI